MAEQPATKPIPAAENAGAEDVRERAVTDLENSGEKMLAAMLDEGQWTIQGNQLLVKVASAAMVERLRSKPGGATLPVAIGDMAELDLSSLPGGGTAR